MKEEIKAKVKEIISANKDAFVNVDLGSFNGVIIIQTENTQYKTIMSKIVELDDMLTNVLDADILDTNIATSFPLVDDENKLRIVIHFA